jgi:hypothetical protein
MCPLCISHATGLLAAAGSAGGTLTIGLCRLRKILSAPHEIQKALRRNKPKEKAHDPSANI